MVGSTVLRRRDRIISSVKARITKSTHRFGIEIPTSKAHAIEIDRKNGNQLWQEALEKEMNNIGVAFEILNDGENVPVGYKKSSGHLIWSHEARLY